MLVKPCHVVSFASVLLKTSPLSYTSHELRSMCLSIKISLVLSAALFMTGVSQWLYIVGDYGLVVSSKPIIDLFSRAVQYTLS